MVVNGSMPGIVRRCCTAAVMCVRAEDVRGDISRMSWRIHIQEGVQRGVERGTYLRGRQGHGWRWCSPGGSLLLPSRQGAGPERKNPSGWPL
jgi:hypothetical protein